LKIDTSKPWSGLQFNVLLEATTIFNALTFIIVGRNGAKTAFWEDPWLNGLTMATVGSVVLALVRLGIVKMRSVQAGLLGSAWVRDTVMSGL
jgi:hypothetical protein